MTGEVDHLRHQLGDALVGHIHSAGAVRLDPVSGPAEQPPDRLLKRLAQQVPDRHVDLTDGHQVIHLGVAPTLKQAVPDSLDLQWVLADDHVLEVVLDQGRRRRTRAKAGQALVGEDLDIAEDTLLVTVAPVAEWPWAWLVVDVHSFDIRDLHADSMERPL